MLKFKLSQGLGVGGYSSNNGGVVASVWVRSKAFLGEKLALGSNGPVYKINWMKPCSAVKELSSMRENQGHASCLFPLCTSHLHPPLDCSSICNTYPIRLEEWAGKRQKDRERLEMVQSFLVHEASQLTDTIQSVLFGKVASQGRKFN